MSKQDKNSLCACGMRKTNRRRDYAPGHNKQNAPVERIISLRERIISRRSKT